jgi:hypothetical protein
MGYLLRHLEEEVFPSAAILHGLDIDAYAVEAGSAHLRELQSNVELFAADMQSTASVMAGRTYDLVLCCGVLMYVTEAAAQEVVRSMFAHAGRLVGLICLAPPDEDAPRSAMRGPDGAFIHDVDRMIEKAGGRIVSTERIGTETSGSSPSHVILAEPSALVRHGHHHHLL